MQARTPWRNYRDISSVNGLGAAPGAAFYSMAKAGVLALTKAAAMEYATDGIRVNGLVAGAFDTPMLNKLSNGRRAEMPNAAKQLSNSSCQWCRFAELVARKRRHGSVLMRPAM